MEYLDYYDENDNYLGFKSREDVHKEGLWHKTVHCWLYDLEGYVYFQIRKDTGTFYTTASGHVLKGETVKEAFKREIFEEIGIDIDSSDATLVNIVTWKMEKLKKDGTFIKDRAKANVYIDLYEDEEYNFNFDKEEVLGLVRVPVRDVLDLFKIGRGKVAAYIIKQDANGKNIVTEKDISCDDFLVTDGETVYSKYSEVLNKIIDVLES